MRTILIYSNKFKGQIVVKYHEEDMLMMYDATGAELSITQLKWLSLRIPLKIDGLYRLVEETGFTVEELPEDLSFDRFWQLYNRKINKARCEPLWKKMKEAEKLMCFRSLPHYENYLNRLNWRSKADPENYLKKGMYKNDWKALT